ncbi:HEPN domain-containing protein [Priestia megaterium]|uniref:hypothetical protein n=1 Tax=Priestia megaterium TaxID=1404 RepID=UPI002E1EAD3C|nr:HEPN domain-containing protein [Priestia megaterium]
MSIDLELFWDEHIEKEEIEKVIFELGFKRNEEEDAYYWFDENFLSTRGCRFSFCYDTKHYRDDTEREVKTYCSTYTHAGRSYYDLEMQIKTIKVLHEKFGGTIYDPEEGEYEIFENFLPKLSSTEMACGMAYLGFLYNLNMVEMLIEEVDIEEIKGQKEIGIFHPSVNLMRNNTLVPFCLSILENFLRMFLERYLITNEEATNIIFKQKGDLKYSVVRDLLKGEKTIVDIELEKYSFQNFDSMKPAYLKYVGIDLHEDVLREKILYDNKETTIISVLTELIEKRHKIIHEAALEDDLGKEKMEKYHFFLGAFGETFINAVMRKRKLKLLLEKEL